MTAVATVIFLVTKFVSGAWVVVVAIPALILLFTRISRYYTNVGAELGFGSIPPKPVAERSLVVVLVTGVSLMTQSVLSTALSLGDEVIAVSVQFDDERAAGLRSDWDEWAPGVELVILRSATRSIGEPMLGYLCAPPIADRPQVLVLIPEVEPHKWRHKLLQNQRGIVLANLLRRHSDVIVARVPYRLVHD